jgi:hypothetical protein
VGTSLVRRDMPEHAMTPVISIPPDARRHPGGPARRCAPHLRPTPLRRLLRALRPREIYLKLECWQPTGSFKVRGALNNLSSLTLEERRRGCRQRLRRATTPWAWRSRPRSLGDGVDATLFVPASAPRTKVEKLRSYNVKVEERGDHIRRRLRGSHGVRPRSGARYIPCLRGHPHRGRPGDDRERRSWSSCPGSRTILRSRGRRRAHRGHLAHGGESPQAKGAHRRGRQPERLAPRCASRSERG